MMNVEPHDDYDTECANCGGEGFTYGCSWDWQCDTYDEGPATDHLDFAESWLDKALAQIRTGGGGE